ncbi:suppressor of tub2 mutation [Vermiconidia calcicola]|uniref:Suppressor of tub2 mutation n=1 Tax=Vermiconidia calcicola TaxID=1690605 RepID=A0ACC3NRW9_9PEZI|nr:suppressor of tub2 mutation [Vermiconidia calcicola]
MDSQAATLLSTLKRPAASSESKLNALNILKSDIKHYRVPETAQATIFECLKLAITQQASSTLASSAFSCFGHLIKRLKIQDASGHSITSLAPRLFPAIHDRLGDMREAQRSAALQALTELHPFLTNDVENVIRDEAIGGSNPRAKQAGLQWVLKMHKEEAMPFKGYTQSMVAKLEDADGNVRETAKNTLIELFKDAPDRAKTDLKKQLKAFSVRHSIESQILAQLGSSAASRPQTASAEDTDMAASTRSLPTLDHVSHFAETINSEAAKPPPPEEVPMDPIYVHSKSELEDAFRSMLPHFEGKETEQNWTPRDKSVLKIRRLTKGNAPSEYHQVYMAGIKSTVDGILKVANSLRTTMSTNGCQLVRELARTLGPALDPHVEVILQSFIKMSAATKHIAAENGKETSDIIFQNCSYHARMMQHIWNAAQDKNAQTRQCAPEWLKTILKRQASYKHHFESSGGLDLAEKCIKKGLDDANPKVKEGTRAAYWTFAESWPERANAIMSTLDPKSKTALEKDSNNPHASLHTSQSVNPAAAARSTGAASRNALREMLEEKRKAKTAGKVPDRAASAMAQLSPAKPRSVANHNNATKGSSHLSSTSKPEASRVASTASTTSETPTSASTARKGSALMSGPVRRPRRPELQRPQTADPYASKRLLRPETPAGASPGNSPPKGTANSKSSIPSSSTARDRSKTAGTAAGSAAGSPARRSPLPGHIVQEPRTTSKGSNGTIGEDLTNVREDDFTMVMPKSVAATNRGAFAPGHKRPGLGQTMSVDAGMPTLTEDDGFTMVIPDLQRVQGRTRSPLAYRSPLKVMFDEAREKVESMSPKQDEHAAPAQAEDRAATPRSGSPAKAAQPEEVQIYEDPFVADGSEAPSAGERKVLAELPVNENVRMQSPTESSGSSTSPTGSPRQAPDARSPMISSTQDRAEVLRNRRLLGSGIDRIRAKTLDAHGFRRVQDLAKSNLDIWENGKKYDELMGVLLEYLQTFDQEPRLTQQAPHKAAGLKAQALGLVRALLYLHKKNAAAWHAKTLVAVLVSRKGVEASSHALADIERTADDVVKQALPEGCIDAIIEYLPSIGTDKGASRSAAMALGLLRQLLDSAKVRNVDLGSERKIRLVQTTAKYLDDADAEVRKADVELASDLFELVGSSKAEFWNEFKGTDEGRLGLLTYYIARRGKARAQ